MVKFFTSFLFLTNLVGQIAHADILFEGYSKILSDGQHVGYVVSRYEFDTKKNQFISTYFLKTGKGPTEITESLHAIADSELNPISYEYTSLDSKGAKTIDAKFKAGTMSAIIHTAGKNQKIEKKIPRGTFLSTFLVYLILKSNDGLHADASYDYQAIAEEEAAIVKGQALVQKQQLHLGIMAFKVTNTFKDSKFLSYINERGEVIGTNALGVGIATELVPTPAEATSGQSYSGNILKTLFGIIPTGSENIMAKSRKVTETPDTAAPSSTKSHLFKADSDATKGK